MLVTLIAPVLLGVYSRIPACINLFNQRHSFPTNLRAEDTYLLYITKRMICKSRNRAAVITNNIATNTAPLITSDKHSLDHRPQPTLFRRSNNITLIGACLYYNFIPLQTTLFIYQEYQLSIKSTLCVSR